MKIQFNQKSLVKLGNICDYIPLISTTKSLVDLIQKYIIIPIFRNSGILKNYYYKKLEKQHVSRCLIISLPVIGNIVIGIIDFKNRKHSGNKEYILKAVQKNANTFHLANETLKNDKEVVKAAIIKDPSIIKIAGKDIQNNKELLSELIVINPEVFKSLPVELKNDQDFTKNLIEKNSENKAILKEVVKFNPDVIKYADSQMQKDEDVLCELISISADVLKYVDDSFRKDKSFCQKAIQKNPKAFDHIDEQLKKDEDFIFEIVKKHPTNHDLVLAAVKLFGSALHHANEKVKNERKIVLEAYQEDPFSLRFASDELKEDKDFILEILTLGTDAVWTSVDRGVWNDFEFMLSVIRINDKLIDYASDDLKKDIDFLIKAIDINPKVVNYILNTYYDDELYLKLIQNFYDKYEVLDKLLLNPYKYDCLSRAGDVLKNNGEFFLYILKQWPNAFKYIGLSLLQDENYVYRLIKKYPKNMDILKMILEMHPMLLEHAPNKFKNETYEIRQIFARMPSAVQFGSDKVVKSILFYAIKYEGASPSIIKYAGIERLKNKDFMLEALKCHVKTLKYADESLKNSEEFMTLALKSTLDAANYLGDELSDDFMFMSRMRSRFRYNIITYAGPKLRNDKRFLLDIPGFFVDTLMYASDEKRKDRSFLIEYLQQNPNQFNYVSHELKNDENFILDLIKNKCSYQNILPCLPTSLWNIEFLNKVIECNPNSFDYIKNKYFEKFGYVNFNNSTCRME